MRSTRRRRYDPRVYLQSIIDAVFEVDLGVRSASIYEEQYLIAGGMRQGTLSYDPDEAAREIDLQLSTMARITANWQKWFGAMKAMVVHYEKVNLLFFQLDQRRFLVVSTESWLPAPIAIERVSAILHREKG